MFNFKGMCVSSRRFATDFSPLVKAYIYKYGARQYRGLWLPTGYVWRGDDSTFVGLCVRGDGRRISALGPVKETWHRWEEGRWAKMSDERWAWWAMAFKQTRHSKWCRWSQSSEVYHCASFSCDWSKISVTVHCSRLISIRHDRFSSRTRHFHFPGEIDGLEQNCSICITNALGIHYAIDAWYNTLL